MLATQLDYSGDMHIIRDGVASIVDMPVVVTVNEFNDESVTEFGSSIHRAQSTGQAVIPIVINSYGGEVYAYYAMMALLSNVDANIATIAVGKAHSCGALLLASGTPGYRYADRNTSIMIHEAWSDGEAGKVHDIRSSADEIERTNRVILQDLARQCDHKDRDHFVNLIHDNNHSDVYLDARAAKKQRLVDHVRMPKMRVRVNTKFEFR